jgi:hypothetical protein
LNLYSKLNIYRTLYNLVILNNKNLLQEFLLQSEWVEFISIESSRWSKTSIYLTDPFVIQTFVILGYNPNTSIPLNLRGRSKCKQTVLHNAVRNYSYDTIKAWLESGADPNIRGLGNETVLQQALCHRAPANILEILIEHGAVIDEKALRIATEKGGIKSRIFLSLLDSGEDKTTPEYKIAYHSYTAEMYYNSFQRNRTYFTQLRTYLTQRLDENAPFLYILIKSLIIDEIWSLKDDSIKKTEFVDKYLEKCEI